MNHNFMKEDRKIEVLLWRFYFHWMWEEQFIIISWIIPTCEIKMYRINFGYLENDEVSLWTTHSIANNENLLNKIKSTWNRWRVNLDWLRKWEIKYPYWRPHFSYIINVSPIIIDYCLWDKIIMFKLIEENNWYYLSSKLRNQHFKIKNSVGKTANVSYYWGDKWFPHKIHYLWSSYIYPNKYITTSESEEWFDNTKFLSTMEDVLNYIEKIIKKYDKNDIPYWDWDKEYYDELPF